MSAVAALCCCTKIKNDRSCHRNQRLTCGQVFTFCGGLRLYVLTAGVSTG
jgi:hypothetical protein